MFASVHVNNKHKLFQGVLDLLSFISVELLPELEMISLCEHVQLGNAVPVGHAYARR